MDQSLTLESVRQFILSNGGKVTNHELVKHFRVFLNDPENQAEARSNFKDYVNTLAVIKQEGSVKYLVLREKYQEGLDPNNGCGNTGPLVLASPMPLPRSSSTEFAQGGNPDDPPAEVMPPPRSKHTRPEIVHSHSSPNILQDVGAAYSPEQGPPCTGSIPSSSSMILQGPWSPDLPPGQAPQPPPRKRSFAKGKENRAGKIEEKLRQLSEEKQVKNGEKTPDQEIPELSLSPGSVKERAQKLNKMASESELKNVQQNLGRKREAARGEKGTDDEDSASVTSLDPRRREWLVKAAKADYLSLVRLLKEEPKLATFKDFTSGFTALHWAAKHGDDNIIKLIAGTHKANPNARSHGGYTPLHLAAMHNHEDIMELLTKTYGADPNIRDYSGKRPQQYLPRVQTAALQHRHGHSQRNKSNDKDMHGFIRMGSLNTKVRRTAAALAGGIGSTKIKSWGSADSLSPDVMSMPPPKCGPLKKKKSKKLPADSFGSLPEPLRGTGAKPSSSHDSDSDSAYGFHS